MTHPLERILSAPAADILTAIQAGFRTTVDVKGKLAELYLFRRLEAELPGLTWHDRDGKPDFSFMRNGRSITIECKNVRSSGTGQPTIELQRTRNRKDSAPRGYRHDKFEILAGCTFNRSGAWNYWFAATAALQRQAGNPDYLEVMQPITGVFPWFDNIQQAIEHHERLQGLPPGLPAHNHGERAAETPCGAEHPRVRTDGEPATGQGG